MPVMPPRPSGKGDRPGGTGGRPRPFAARGGNRKRGPTKPPEATVRCRVVVRYSRFAYSRRRSSGSGVRCSTTTKAASRTRPGTAVPSTDAEAQPEDEPVDSANMVSGKPEATSRKPGRSKRPAGYCEPEERNSA